MLACLSWAGGQSHTKRRDTLHADPPFTYESLNSNRQLCTDLEQALFRQSASSRRDRPETTQACQQLLSPPAIPKEAASGPPTTVPGVAICARSEILLQWRPRCTVFLATLAGEGGF